MNDRKPLILLVEDDQDLAQLNARLLKRQGYDTLEAHSARQTLGLLVEAVPDLFVIDVGLPDFDGLSLCREIRKKTDAPVLFLTGRTDTKDKISGLQVGGDYYLTKPYDRQEFLAVVETLLRKAEQVQRKIDEAICIERGPLKVSVQDRKAYVDGQDVHLTAKEFSLLLLLLRNEEKELTYEEIYNGVWGASMHSDSRALRKQISRLKQKLGDEERDEFSIVNEQGKGYRFTTK